MLPSSTPQCRPPCPRASPFGCHSRASLPNPSPQYSHDDEALTITALENHAVVGQAKVPVAAFRGLSTGQGSDRHVPLMWGGRPAGTLVVRAERLASAPHRPAHAASTAAGRLAAVPFAIPHSVPVNWAGTVRVTVQSADLATRKSVRHLDPYVRMKFSRNRYETMAKYGSSNPVCQAPGTY